MKKIDILILSLVMLFSFSYLLAHAPKAKADIWGANHTAAILKQTLENVQRQIEGVLLATLKNTAATALNSQVASLVGGSSVDDSKIITDWQKYLYDEPLEKTRIYMDSYLATVRGGRNSSNYKGAAASYSQYLDEYTRSNLYSLSDQKIYSSNAEEIVPDMAAALDSGSIRAYHTYFSSDFHNPIGSALMAQEVEMKMYELYKEEQVLKATSHGYKPVETKDGKTVLPGDTIGNIVSNVQDIGNKIIATSNNPAELASGVILSFVNKTITSLLQKGLGTIQSSIESEVANVVHQVDDQLEVITTTAGTLEQYSSEVKQQVNTTIDSTADGAQAVPISI